MKKNSISKDLYVLIPLVFSGCFCIGLTFVLWKKSIAIPNFIDTLSSFMSVFIGISGFIAFFILFYLLFTIFTVKKIKTNASGELGGIVKKMNLVREIIEILLDSKLWLSGVKDYIDDEYEGLTFFEVKEFYKGKSKLAIEFLQEKQNYLDTETLYLELKSLLMTEPKQKKIPSAIIFPDTFKKEMVDKWLEHKVGSGLWYYFGYKFGAYKEALDVEAVFDRHQDKIMTLANSIDHQLFEDSSFNEVFFSKLGEYINKDLLPKLHKEQNEANSSLPSGMGYLYSLFTGVISIGVILPLLFVLFQLPSITLIFSFSFIISILFFLMITIYPFLHKNIQ